MRTLDLQDIQNVAGGDYTLTLTANVATDMEAVTTQLFAGVINGTIVGTDAFMAAVGAAIANGADFSKISIEQIAFTDIR